MSYFNVGATDVLKTAQSTVSTAQGVVSTAQAVQQDPLAAGLKAASDAATSIFNPKKKKKPRQDTSSAPPPAGNRTFNVNVPNNSALLNLRAPAASAAVSAGPFGLSTPALAGIGVIVAVGAYLLLQKG